MPAISSGFRMVEWNERHVFQNDSSYALFYSNYMNQMYRCEYLPWGLFEVPFNPDAKGNFTLRLPKVPRELLLQAYSFFLNVYNEYGTESALQLFWDTDNGQYYWHVPTQHVSETTVHFTRDSYLEYHHWLIMDFHSHGRFCPFFSRTDNADEKGTRLYGVIGNLHTRPQFLLRAGSGGFFTDVLSQGIWLEDSENALAAETLPIDRVIPLI